MFEREEGATPDGILLQENQVRRATEKLIKLGDWLDGLGEEHRKNLMWMVSQSNAEQLIADCPDKEYREWATCALNLYRLNEGII